MPPSDALAERPVDPTLRMTSRGGVRDKPETNWHFVELLTKAEVMGTRHQAGPSEPGGFGFRSRST
jgi:hypothetical protein